MRPLRRAWELLRDTMRRYLDNGGPLLSAALAFFAILSIAPLVLVAVSVAGLAFGDDAARGELHGRLAHWVGGDAARHVESTVELLRHEQGSGSTRATLLGALLVLFGASRLFAQIQEAINQLWYVRTGFSDLRQGILVTVRKKLISFALVLTLGLLFTGSLLVNALAATVRQLVGQPLPGSELFWAVVPAATSVVLVALMFALIYRLLPNAQVAWRDAGLGGLLAAVLFTLAEYPLSLYLAHQGTASAYGAAGSLVVFLLWVYYAAQIFFLGAQFTWVYAEAQRRPMRPDPVAVIVREVPLARGGDADGPAPP